MTRISIDISSLHPEAEKPVYASTVYGIIASIAQDYMRWEDETSWLSPEDWDATHEWWKATDELLPKGKLVLHKEDLWRIMDVLDERDWSLKQGTGGYWGVDYVLGQRLRKLVSRMEANHA